MNAKIHTKRHTKRHSKRLLGGVAINPSFPEFDTETGVGRTLLLLINHLIDLQCFDPNLPIRDGTFGMTKAYTDDTLIANYVLNAKGMINLININISKCV